MKLFIIALLIVGLLLFGCTGTATDKNYNDTKFAGNDGKTGGTDTGTTKNGATGGTGGTTSGSDGTTTGGSNGGTGSGSDGNSGSTIEEKSFAITAQEVCNWLSTSEVATACGAGKVTTRVAEGAGPVCAYEQEITVAGSQVSGPLLVVQADLANPNIESNKAILKSTLEQGGWNVVEEPAIGDYAIALKMGTLESYALHVYKGNTVVYLTSANGGNAEFPVPFCNVAALEELAKKIDKQKLS